MMRKFMEAEAIKSLLARHLPELAKIEFDFEGEETEWRVYYPLMSPEHPGYDGSTPSLKLKLQWVCVFALTMERGVKVCRPYHFNKEYQRKAQELDAWHDDILRLLCSQSSGSDVTLAERKRHDEQTAEMIGRILDWAVREWEEDFENFPIDDLSEAYNQVEGFASIANRMKSRLGDLFVSHIDGHGYADFYEEVTDSGYYGLIEAYEAAQQEIQEMVDHGMADDGYEDAVQERINANVFPVLEDAIKQFQRDHDVSKYQVDYRHEGGER